MTASLAVTLLYHWILNAATQPQPSPSSASGGSDVNTATATVTGALIGAIAAIGASIIGNIVTYLLQLRRDEAGYTAQKLRDEQLAKDDVERRRIAYLRAAKDGRRRHVRYAYRAILKAARAYAALLSNGLGEQGVDGMSHEEGLVGTTERRILGDVDAALVSLALDDVSPDIERYFLELRMAFISYQTALSETSGGTGRGRIIVPAETLAEHRQTVNGKLAELTEAMRTHLRELEEPD